MISENEVLERVRNVTVWRRGGERAPHKPLLLLYALGKVEEGAPASISYESIDTDVGALLQDFGPPRRTRAADPYWYLRNDGLWVVRDADSLELKANGKQPSERALRESGSEGGFPPEIFRLLHSKPQLRHRIARELLAHHFPASIHEDLLAAAGLPVDWATMGPSDTPSTGGKRSRRAGFRGEVLEAYGYACAVCGFDLRLGHKTVGLDAAHIRWHTADGPDLVTNGLALCAIHHRALDLGVVGVDLELCLTVSTKANGARGFEEMFGRYSGAPIRKPHSYDLQPLPEHLEWHRSEVFRSPARRG